MIFFYDRKRSSRIIEGRYEGMAVMWTDREEFEVRSVPGGKTMNVVAAFGWLWHGELALPIGKYEYGGAA